MNNVVKTAGIITSGIIVGALIRKVVQQGISLKKQPIFSESIKNAKNIFEKEAIREDVNEFFI
jgi:hypothetical protein